MDTETLAGALLAVLAAASSAVLSYIGLLLLRAERILGSDSPAPLGLLLLASSQASSAVLALASDRTAYVAYLFSSASFAAGIALLSQPRARSGQLTVIPFPLLYAALGDAAAAAAGVYAASRSRGPARILLGVAGASFLARLLGLLLLPSPEGAALLAGGEAARAVALAGLAAAYKP